MSKEKLLEIRKYLSQALLLIDELLSKESTLPKIELKVKEEIEEIPWKKLGRWEYAYIHNFPPSFIQQLRDKGYLSKDGYLYKLKKNKYGIAVIRKKVIEKF
ncbi:MAG: hypothetical protein QXF09_04780 [Nitrososphaerota archaeon]